MVCWFGYRVWIVLIDVVYIKGKTSPSNDEEIRYSLRSLHCVTDLGRVFITGNRPSFVTNVIHTPCDDIGCRTINHWYKVTQTILQTDISDDFILMYDDIFFTKEVSLSNYPFYNTGEMRNHTSGTPAYIENIREAERVLKKMGKPTLDYSLHVPCIYNREKFLQLQEIYKPYIKRGLAPSVRCVYGNMFNVRTEYREDLKLRGKDSNIGDKECFSTSDESFKNIYNYLKERFPERCKYEIS